MVYFSADRRQILRELLEVQITTKKKYLTHIQLRNDLEAHLEKRFFRRIKKKTSSVSADLSEKTRFEFRLRRHCSQFLGKKSLAKLFMRLCKMDF
jgi:hypothetical protein